MTEQEQGAAMMDLLEEMANKNNGILTLRKPMGAAGEVHRHRAEVVADLVRNGYARWVNRQQTMARITSEGVRQIGGGSGLDSGVGGG